MVRLPNQCKVGKICVKKLGFGNYYIWGFFIFQLVINYRQLSRDVFLVRVKCDITKIFSIVETEVRLIRKLYFF